MRYPWTRLVFEKYVLNDFFYSQRSYFSDKQSNFRIVLFE